MTYSNSRFKVLEKPVVNPGCCFTCSGVSGAPFIDTGVDTQWDGAIYLCKRCIEEMARNLGLFEPKEPTVSVEVPPIEEKLAELLEAANMATVKMVGDVYNEYVNAVASSIPVTDSLSAGLPVLESGDGEEGDSGDTQESDTGNSGEGSTDTDKSDSSSVKVSKSSGKSGRNNVSSDTGDGTGLQLSF